MEREHMMGEPLEGFGHSEGGFDFSVSVSPGDLQYDVGYEHNQFYVDLDGPAGEVTADWEIADPFIHNFENILTPSDPEDDCSSKTLADCNA